MVVNSASARWQVLLPESSLCKTWPPPHQSGSVTTLPQASQSARACVTLQHASLERQRQHVAEELSRRNSVCQYNIFTPGKTTSSHQHLPTHRDRSNSPTRILVMETLWTRHVSYNRWAVQSQADVLPTAGRKDFKGGWRAAQFLVSATGRFVIDGHWDAWR
jgi:hypothetical protein